MRKLQRLKRHPSQHPLHDVAVVAQQPAGRAAVVAVVSPDLAPVEASSANRAGIPLFRKQFGEQGGMDAGAPSPLSVQPRLLAPRVGCARKPKLSRPGLGFGACVPLPAHGSCFRLRFAQFSGGLHVRAGGVFTKPCALLFDVFQPPCAVVL